MKRKPYSMASWAMLLAIVLPIASFAQAYPEKPLRFVVPYPAGGPLDTVARLLGQKVSESVKQPVVVENRPGAGGNIGADHVAKSAPDGYTLLMGAVATHAINPSLYKQIPYDPIRDFIAVTMIASTPNVLVVHPSVPASSVREFITYAKANPGKLNFGSGSTGSAGHLAGELFKTMAGVDMAHIPYKGAQPALTDVIAGEVQLMFATSASVIPFIKAGKLRALAVSAGAADDQRSRPAGLRYRDVVRRLRARGHAARGRHAPERRDLASPPDAGDERASRDARRRGDAEYARSVRGIRQSGNGEVPGDRARLRRESGLSTRH